jgi:NDP-sugar pyrophosphorylase family protein
MNGDIITQLDFTDIINFARYRDYEMTVGYVHHVYKSPFGVLTIDRNGEIVNITEKPRVDYCISGGIYVLKGSALDYVRDGEFFAVPNLIQALRSRGRAVGAYHIKEYWQGVENVGHIERARETLNGHLEKVFSHPG